MTTQNYAHARSKDIDWRLAKKGHQLGDVFESIWCREFMDCGPNAWEIKLCSGQELPAHIFSGQTVQIFTAGSVSIEGEAGCEEGATRWAEGGVASGSWKASSDGARFYLVGMNDLPKANLDSSSSEQASGGWQTNHPDDLDWGEVGDGEHVAPPGKICALCPGGPSVMKMIFDPNCIASPHSHPGNILYIVLKGQMTVPEEGTYGEGDMRWARKDYAYGQEVMGTEVTTLIALQRGDFAALWT